MQREFHKALGTQTCCCCFDAFTQSLVHAHSRIHSSTYSPHSFSLIPLSFGYSHSSLIRLHLFITHSPLILIHSYIHLSSAHHNLTFGHAVFVHFATFRFWYFYAMNFMRVITLLFFFSFLLTIWSDDMEMVHSHPVFKKKFVIKFWCVTFTCLLVNLEPNC